MPKRNDGGPAFARAGFIDTSSGTLPDGDFVVGAENGMSLRDWFAGKAMQGILVSNSEPDVKPVEIALWAYELADAMLEERSK